MTPPRMVIKQLGILSKDQRSKPHENQQRGLKEAKLPRTIEEFKSDKMDDNYAEA